MMSYKYKFEVRSDVLLRARPVMEKSDFISEHPGGTEVYGNKIFTYEDSKAGVWTKGDQWLEVEKIGDVEVEGYMPIKHRGKTEGYLRLIKEEPN